MNSISHLGNYRDVDFNTKSPIFFPVKVVEDVDVTDPLTGQSYGTEAWQAVVNEGTGQTLGIHKGSWKLTRNSEIFPIVDKALQRSELDLTGMRVQDQISHGGGRTFREYIFPSHTTEIARVDDVVQLRLIFRTSYDGSSALRSQFGAFRLVCTNGMVVGDIYATNYRKNTLGLDVSDVVTNIKKGIHGYLEETQRWQRWAKTTITEAEVQSVIAAFPGINEKLEEKLMNNWKDERDELGSTQWALFNALTYWSTHDEVRESRVANSAAIIASREDRVQRAINTPQFLALAA